MNIKGENHPENQEVDLLLLFKKAGNFLDWINTSLFKMIRFFIKNAIVVAVLIVAGVGIGIYLKQSINSYEQKIIVTPNFKSTDYLYTKIDLLSSKIALKDTVFLKLIGIKNPLQVSNIAVGPIVNIDNLINKEDKGFQLLQFMGENEGLKSIVKDSTLNRNYTLHTIVITTSGMTSAKNTVEPVLKFLNTSTYYREFATINSRNIQHQIQTKETTIAQIDGILNKFSAVNHTQSGNDKLVYYNENLNLDKVIEAKDSLSDQIGTLKLELYNSDKIIKERGMILNIKKYKSIKGKLMFILPVLFVGLFIFFSFFISFYKKQSLKAQQISA